MPKTPETPADPGGAALDTGPGKLERVPHSPDERVPKPPAPGDRQLVEESERAEPSGLGRLPLIGRLFRSR
jgi:hypothetical protein